MLDLAKFVNKGVQVKLTGGEQGTPRCSLPSLWAPDARQAVDAPNLKAGRATPAAPASVVLNFAPGQLPQIRRGMEMRNTVLVDVAPCFGACVSVFACIC
nr:uncharacterized protein LOC123493671 isoform X4 [Aegilops tauschii subsp. strangulata]